MARFAAALSEHPLPTHATGEVVGEVLEAVGDAPDLCVLFVTGPHAGVLEDIARSVHSLLHPGALVGATAVSVLARRTEAEEVPAVALWAGRVAGATTRRLTVVPGPEGARLEGVEADELDAAGTMLCLADPASFPVDAVLDALAEAHPGLQVVGGLASAGFGPGANHLVADGRVVDDGAVAVLLPPGAGVATVVSQGCGPVGQPLTVTASTGNVIAELAGRPALERLQELLAGLPEDQRDQAARGLHVGRVIDEHRLDFERGDFLVRNVLGVDRATGAVAVGDQVAVGDTVQFHVRDALSADTDLRLLLDGRRAEGALVFTCNGRGRRFFGEEDHDARVVAESIGTEAVAGMFCAGEIGPVGPRSFLHGFTASTVLFGIADGG